MPNINVTIVHIAQKLKISPSTVSRALRNHPDVNKETKLKVMALADEMRYNPNRLAQSLKGKSTKTLGVIVPEIKHEFFSSVISGIEHTAYGLGYSILLTQSNEDYQREIMNTRTLLSHRVDGILVSISQNTLDSDHFKNVLRNNVPLVFFDRVVSNLKCATVECDDYHGAFLAVEHLIRRGYKRIAHFAEEQTDSKGRNRKDGGTAQHTAQRVSELLIGDRVRRCGVHRANQRVVSDGVLDDPDEIVEGDPAHVLFAAAESPAHAQLERGEHLFERSTLGA